MAKLIKNMEYIRSKTQKGHVYLCLICKFCANTFINTYIILIDNSLHEILSSLSRMEHGFDSRRRYKVKIKELSKKIAPFFVA